jgi:hypothetical protein
VSKFIKESYGSEVWWTVMNISFSGDDNETVVGVLDEPYSAE